MRKCASISLSQKMLDRIRDYRKHNPEFNLSRRIEKLLSENLDKVFKEGEMR